MNPVNLPNRGQISHGCFNHDNLGPCDNKRTLKRQVIEARVIAGLKDTRFAPDPVAEFIKSFQEETNVSTTIARWRQPKTRLRLRRPNAVSKAFSMPSRT